MQIKLLVSKGEIDASFPFHYKKNGILVDDGLLLDAGEKSYKNETERHRLDFSIFNKKSGMLTL